MVSVELLELLPQAAIRALVASAASASSARRVGVCVWVNVCPCRRGCSFQPPFREPNRELTAELPPPAAPEPVAELPAPPLLLLAPESLIEVAASMPLLFFSPLITTESPGCSDRFETPRLLVILVAEDSVTLTVFPEVSVM